MDPSCGQRNNPSWATMFHMLSFSRRLLVSATAALGLCFVACAPLNAATPSATEASTNATSGLQGVEGPGPAEPKHQQTRLPDCSTANPLAAKEGKEFFDSIDLDLSEQTGPTDLEVFTRLAGPAAQEAMNEALQTQACRWPLYIAGHAVTQYSTTVTKDTQKSLIESLRESDFVETTLGPAALFTHAVEDPTNYRMNGATTIQYMFTNNAWIAIFETGESDYAQSALDALFAFNPQMQ